MRGFSGRDILSVCMCTCEGEGWLGVYFSLFLADFLFEIGYTLKASTKESNTHPYYSVKFRCSQKFLQARRMRKLKSALTDVSGPGWCLASVHVCIATQE